MFHPVGPRTPGVYWRRRLVLAAAIVIVLVLLIVTVHAVFSGNGSAPAGQQGQSPTGGQTAPAPTTTALTTAPTTGTATTPGTATATGPAATGHSPAPKPLTTPATRPATSPGTGTAPGTGGTGTATVAAAACTPAQLALQAVPQQASWKVGDEPVLGLQVTNTATTPCVQDVSDSQIELQVYNGAARVWGSHDCKVQPGTLQRTLMPNTKVSFTITWTGLSSKPNCAGTRQRVGAGTYTLFASLAGHEATTAGFVLK